MRAALSKKDIDAQEGIPVPGAVPTVAPPAKPEPQSYTEQILKYIPAEVVAFYIPALAAAVALKPPSNGTAPISAYDVVVWVIFGLGLIGTFIYIRKQAEEELKKNQIANAPYRAKVKAAMSTFAFLFWALYLGGPFANVNGYETYGTLAILGFTFLTPAIYDAIPIPKPKP